MDTPVITVIIPAADAQGLLPMGLAHLEVQSYPAARFDVIIADYGDGDASDAVEKYIQGTPVRMRYLRAPGGTYADAANRALAEATSNWVLFLDEDLLAGPNLVEQHIASQERHDGDAALAGRIKLHPHAAPTTLTKWGVWPPRDSESPSRAPGQAAPAAPLHFLDWRTWNLSVSRRRILDAGGFSEAVDIQGAEDSELAGRLRDGGLKGFTAPAAVAYAWRASELAREREREYNRGRALHQLETQRERPGLARKQLPAYGPLRRALLRPSAFMAGCLAPLFAGNHAALCRLTRMMLDHARFVGYLDAQRGRPPRPPGGCQSRTAPAGPPPES